MKRKPALETKYILLFFIIRTVLEARKQLKDTDVSHIGQLDSIEKTFELCKTPLANLKHHDNANLTAIEEYPIFPYTHGIKGVVQCTFSMNPVDLKPGSMVSLYL